jgi:hypothetical protein
MTSFMNDLSMNGKERGEIFSVQKGTIRSSRSLATFQPFLRHHLSSEEKKEVSSRRREGGGEPRQQQQQQQQQQLQHYLQTA